MNNAFDTYVSKNLSPSASDRDFISKKYDQLKTFLLGKNIFQSGSYARFTSIAPVNDLDIIWVLPKDFIAKTVKPEDLDPQDILKDLANNLEQEYKKAGEQVRVEPQSHSVGIYFGAKDDFSIDIVPAIPTNELNQFGDCLYLVPEVSNFSKKSRKSFYAKAKGHIKWIKTDPRGYIEVNKKLNDYNDSFRKAVKFVKGWKRNCKRANPLFPLKSFHLEMVIYNIFLINKDLTTYEAIKEFFNKLPSFIENPSVKDRANNDTYIDEYINEIDKFDKREICELCRLACRVFAEFDSVDSNNQATLIIEKLISGADTGEEFVHLRFPFADDLIDLKVHGHVQHTNTSGSFTSYYLHERANFVLGKERSISFSLGNKKLLIERFPGAILKWKVKNRIFNYSLEQPRGEINDYSTTNNPEKTSYGGQHFVDCYAIDGGKCIGFGRQYVVISI